MYVRRRSERAPGCFAWLSYLLGPRGQGAHLRCAAVWRGAGPTMQVGTQSLKSFLGPSSSAEVSKQVVSISMPPSAETQEHSRDVRLIAQRSLSLGSRNTHRNAALEILWCPTLQPRRLRSVRSPGCESVCVRARRLPASVALSLQSPCFVSASRLGLRLKAFLGVPLSGGDGIR